MYTVHSKPLKRCTFATDGHDPFIYDSDIGRYVPVEELVLSLSKGPEGEPALSAVEGVQRVQKRCRNDFQKCTRSQSWTAPHSALAGAAGAGILKKLFRHP